MNCIYIEHTNCAKCTCNYAIRNTPKALHVPGQLSPLAFNIRAQIKQQTT